MPFQFRMNRLVQVLVVVLFTVSTLIIPAAPRFAAAQEATPEAIDPITLPPVDPLSYTGNIVIAGSSTVYPLTLRMAERFAEEGFVGRFVIQSIGTGAGIERFCVANESDIANASRAIRQSEIDECIENGRTPIEYLVGLDALAVVVSGENDFIESLSLEQLAQIFSGAVTTWDEVDPSFPAEPIAIFIPGTDSGTYDFFVESVLLNTDFFPDEESATQTIVGMSNVQLSEDDNVLVQGVENNPYAIGYFGFAYFQAEGDLLRAIAINAGDGAVEPTAESAEDGSYPLARPLFIYSDAGIMADKPQVAEFINFYLTNVLSEIIDVGYFPPSSDALNRARQNWLDGMGL